jgi:hypothetical protein
LALVTRSRVSPLEPNLFLEKLLLEILIVFFVVFSLIRIRGIRRDITAVVTKWLDMKYHKATSKNQASTTAGSQKATQIQTNCGVAVDRLKRPLVAPGFATPHRLP